MRKVSRLPEPESLRTNGVRWTQDLNEQIELKGEYSKVSDAYKNRYRQEDVKEALEQMYNKLCCYCESKIGPTGYERIEHLRPKSLAQFHDLHFQWNNLHLSCEVCNTKKSNNWDEQNPILDPVEDEPCEHLQYAAYIMEAKTLRGRTTINHTKLNRDDLIDARKQVFSRVMTMIERIHNEGDLLKKESLYQELQVMLNEKESYCSFIQHLIERYLKPYWANTNQNVPHIPE